MGLRGGALALGLALLVCLSHTPAGAVRPFITDDARVVGRGRLQLETWLRGDPRGLQHWVLAALGPSDDVELSVGLVHEVPFDDRGRYGIIGPLVQAKILFHPAHRNSWPGVAIAFGLLPPGGAGSLAQDHFDSYGYLALTENLFPGERLLIHANVGFFAISPSERAVALTWGVGAQLRTFAGLHVVAELVSGDPYAASSAGAAQGGLRYFFNDNIQIDATAGGGVWGEDRLPAWGTVGLRLVSNPLW